MDFKLEKVNRKWVYDDKFLEWLRDNSKDFNYLTDIARYLKIGEDSLRLIINKNNLSLEYKISKKNKDYNGNIYNKNHKGYFSQKEGFNIKLINWINDNYKNYKSIKDLAINIGITTTTLRKLIKINKLDKIHNYFINKNHKPEDKLIGTYIGNLYINKEVDKNKKDSHRKYECICKCGSINNYTSVMLKRRKKCNECINKDLKKSNEEKKILKKINDKNKYNVVKEQLLKDGYREILNNDGYFVSNYGIVIHICKKRKEWDKRQLNPFTSRNGYLYLSINGHKRGIHQLVALMFCDGYKDGLVVNHKDLNKKNNYYLNLEWITHKENTSHYYNTTGNNSTQNYCYYELISPVNKKYGLFKGYKEVENYIIENNFDIKSKSLRYYGKSKGWALKYYDKNGNDVSKFYGK